MGFIINSQSCFSCRRARTCMCILCVGKVGCLYGREGRHTWAFGKISLEGCTVDWLLRLNRSLLEFLQGAVYEPSNRVTIFLPPPSPRYGGGRDLSFTYQACTHVHSGRRLHRQQGIITSQKTTSPLFPPLFVVVAAACFFPGERDGNLMCVCARRRREG